MRRFYFIPFYYMTSTLSCRLLSKASISELLPTFNAAFSDYSIPMHLTQAQLEEKLSADGVQLDCSVGVYDDSKLVAFLLNAVDGVTCYNSATGVIPSYRSRGLSSLMIEKAVAHLKEIGCEQYYLEVLEANLVAQMAYEKKGFTKVRTVSCLEGIAKPIKKAMELRYTDLPYYEYLIYYAQKDSTPAWQNNDFAVANSESQVGIKRITFKQQFAGYVVYHPVKQKLLQLWITPILRRQGIGSQVLQAIFEPGSRFTVTNVDLQSEVIRSFFSKNGLNEYVKQFEMKRIL